MGNTLSGVGVIDKGVAILDAVECQPMNASELARELGVATSTVHRLAIALAAHGLLRRDIEGRFHLGGRFASAAVTEVAWPVLQQLCDLTGESTQLWVHRGDSRVCLVSVESPAELRVGLPVGTRLRLPAGSAGQVLQDQDHSPNDAVATNGWAESVAQRTPGLGSVSAPVRFNDQVIAAVCVSAPLHRLKPSPGRVHGQAVLAAAHQIESALGT